MRAARLRTAIGKLAKKHTEIGKSLLDLNADKERETYWATPRVGEGGVVEVPASMISGDSSTRTSLILDEWRRLPEEVREALRPLVEDWLELHRDSEGVMQEAQVITDSTYVMF